MRKVTLAVAFTAVAVLAAVGGGGLANAEGNGVHVNAYQQLRFQNPGDPVCTGLSSVGWQTVSQHDPFDSNSRALVVTLGTNPTCVSAYSRASLNINKLVGNVKNLSFDFLSNEHVGGVPRFSLIFGNGDVGYMGADRCTQPLVISGNVWSRADWTGANLSNSALCNFDVTGSTGGVYSSTLTQSAWQVYVAAHPNQVLKQVFMVWDFSVTPPQTYTVDRISMGTGFMFNNDNTHAIKCTTEATC
jgi:hypothetical protein